MKQGKFVWLTLMLVLGVSSPLTAEEAPAGAPARAPEIEAKCWSNAQPVRLYDAPKLVLLVFWSSRSRESRELLETLEPLHEGFGPKGLLVVGLTSDDCGEAERFIHLQKTVKYKLGAESGSEKPYKVDELPTVVLVDSSDQRIVERWSGRKAKIPAIV